jgi:hypothetical protein
MPTKSMQVEDQKNSAPIRLEIYHVQILLTKAQNMKETASITCGGKIKSKHVTTQRELKHHTLFLLERNRGGYMRTLEIFTTDR